jgi:hypothetical protein
MPVLCIHAILVLTNLKQRGYSSFPTSTQCPQDVLWISCERKPSVCLASATDILWMECLDQENTVHTGMSYGCPSVPIWDLKLIVRFRSLFWYPYDVQFSSRMYVWLHIRDWYQMDIHRTSQYDHPLSGSKYTIHRISVANAKRKMDRRISNGRPMDNVC